MEIKSWRELSKKKSRRRKNKLSRASQNNLPTAEITTAIEQMYLSQTPAVASQEEQNDNNMKKNNYYKKSKFSQSKKTSHNKKIKNGIFWMIIVFLLLSSATLLYSAFRFGGAGSSRDDIELTLTGPESVAIGEESTWVINYKNISKVNLEKINISVRYPDGLKLKSTEPAADNLLNTSWQMGELPKGEAGEIKINAQLYGEENDSKDFVVEVVYQPANFSSDFIESLTKSVKLGQSQFSIAWQLPESILPEVEQDMSWQISNLSGQELSAVRIRLITSKNFVMTNPRPEIAEIADVPEGKAYIWPTRNFMNNQSISFNFKGKFSAGVSGLEKFKIEISSGEDNVKVLQETEKNIVILGEELALQMTINNQTTLNEVAPGQKLNYQLILQNTSGLDLKDLQVVLKTNADMVAWETLKTAVEPTIGEDGQIILTGDNFPLLQTLAKGQELKINYEVSLKNNLTNLSDNYRTYAEVTVGKVGEEQKNDLSFSTPVQSAKIISPVKVLNYAWYRDDEGIPVGTGPLPPKVGQKTVFPIDLTIQTKTDYDSVNLTASLPADVVWEGNQVVDQGNLNFDSVTRQLSWQINSLTTNDGQVTARFFVSLTPQSSDIGKVKILLNSQTIKLLQSGEESQLVYPSLDTNLSGAMYDINQGKVTE